MPLESTRLRMSHGQFAVWFVGLLFVACNAPNIDRLARWFVDKSGHDYLALACYLIAGLCLCLVFFLLFAHRWTIKPVAALLVVASASATYFISKYDVAVDSSMLRNLLHTDPVEVGQLLSLRMIPYALLLMALPLWAIAAVEITFAGRGRYLLESVKIGALALVVAVGSLYAQYTAILRAGNVSNKYIVYSLVPVNLISGSMSALSKAARPYLRRAKVVTISGRVARPGDLVVVLAVGESSRRRNFSLYGYRRRDTNPVLRTIGGLHLLNGVARRGSTLDALPEILAREGVTLPQIVSRLGVPTSCDVNYTLYENCTEPGETKANHCGHGGRCYDEDVLPLLDADLGAYRQGYRFIVLHLGGGSHGPTYRDRHPPEFLRFEPACRAADVATECSQEELYNSYDNTILYADFVVGEILGRLERSGLRYVFLYMSDHGESLLEEGRMFHGMPPGIALPPEQAEVPLLVKASVPIRVLPRDEYSQQDVFDTVLALFSIETPIARRGGSFIERIETPP